MDESPMVATRDTPVIVSGRDSAAEASHPHTVLDDRFHSYESNPVPWWLTILWVSFLIFGLVYLVASLIE